MTQLAISFEPPPAEHWHSRDYCMDMACRGCLKLSVLAVRDGYTHMIRGDNDPERTSRSARHGETTKVMRDRKTLDVAAAIAEVHALLSDGNPRTFNAIGVALWNLTADIIDDRVWHALVDEFVAGRLEHTLRAPILIRKPV